MQFIRFVGLVQSADQQRGVKEVYVFVDQPVDEQQTVVPVTEFQILEKLSKRHA